MLFFHAPILLIPHFCTATCYWYTIPSFAGHDYKGIEIICSGLLSIMCFGMESNSQCINSCHLDFHLSMPDHIQYCKVLYIWMKLRYLIQNNWNFKSLLFPMLVQIIHKQLQKICKYKVLKSWKMNHSLYTCSKMLCDKG